MRLLLESGFEKISLYIAVDDIEKLGLGELLRVVNIARKFGIVLRLGEPPYAASHMDLRTELLLHGIDVGG